jgi:hypothetical protein
MTRSSTSGPNLSGIRSVFSPRSAPTWTTRRDPAATITGATTSFQNGYMDVHCLGSARRRRYPAPRRPQV